MNWFDKLIFSQKNQIASIAILAAFLMTSVSGLAQDMQNMPGMSKSKPAAQKKRAAPKKKPAVKKHEKGNMAGMSMPGMKMPGRHKPTHARRRKRVARKRQPAKKHEMGNMPGMNMPKTQASPSKTTPGTPTPQPSPKQMNMPGMQIPATSPSPSASPQKMEMSMPAPSPGASPQKMDMNMPMPAATPAASPEKMDPNMPGMDKGRTTLPSNSMSISPLIKMSGSLMTVIVGASPKNALSMGQMGSGTSWEPASTPMYMLSKSKRDWLLMFHYNLVTDFNSQGGLRGVKKFESENWFMGMALHHLGPGMLELRGMVSAEPFTIPPGGSPLLFQTGETYKGQPLIDKQHPHDLFMEISTTYTVPLGERGTWFAYFGYPGEPALGPTAFMHRASASENPAAPLSHHLQDSTHVSFGVFTTGFTYRWFKLEGSIFNGREPDEKRYNFEAHPWNSRSVRLSFAPNTNWSMQVSYGFLRHPEALEPGDIRRTTASISYNKPFQRGNWATSLIWGRNHLSSADNHGSLNGYTGESTLNFLDKNTLYTRLELVDKDDLLRATDRERIGITQLHPSFRIGAYTFGGARNIWEREKLSLDIGSDVTFYSKPPVLDQFYGNHPVSWRLFLRVRPGRMDMTKSGMHDMGNMSEEPKAKP